MPEPVFFNSSVIATPIFTILVCSASTIIVYDYYNNTVYASRLLDVDRFLQTVMFVTSTREDSSLLFALTLQ